MTKVAVLGGGNGAHAAAADLALRGFEVRMYEDERFAGKMKKVFDTGTIEMIGPCGSGTASIALVTSDLEAALEGVRYVLIAVPAFAHKAYAEKLAPVIRPGQLVFLLPGTFGSLLFRKAFREAGAADVVVAETHTLPYAARLAGEGVVQVMSRFNPLKVGVVPGGKTRETVEELSQFFDGLEASESAIACGLSSLNPIIHVPGCILNAGRIEYAKGEFFFYTEGFTSCVVRATEAVDRERIALLKKFGYQWDVAARGIGSQVDTGDLHEAVAGNPSFAQIKGPADVKNRYYAEDIPYGIALWAKLAGHVGVEVPVMDSLVCLGSVILEEDCRTAGHSMEDLGIAGMDLERIHTYLQTGE